MNDWYDNFIHLRLLLSVEGIGSGKIRNLLAKFKSPDEILSADFISLAETEGISEVLAKKIIKNNSSREELISQFDNELKELEKLQAQVVTIWDKDYPDLLKKIYDPPILFYKKGEFSTFDNYSVAVVGTRIPTHYGKIQVDKITTELARQNITIVSGLARGIDSLAHTSALKNGGRTIAVIGSGLNVIYPPENKFLYDKIIENGLILSEFPLNTNPDAQNFPRRNRIISGLSLGTIVIESAKEGGSLQTASFALDQGREVFALPGNIGVRQSEGTNLLIQKGEAKLITCGNDVIDELEIKLKPILGQNIPLKQEELNIFEEKILQAMDSEPLQIDNISALTGLSTSDCLVHLLSLEFKGLIKQLPGKVFVRM